MKKALFIGYIWPEPSTTAAGHRIIQLIQAFIDFGYKIRFATTASASERSFPLEKMGVATTKIQMNHSSFDEFLKELDPSIVVFDRFMTEEQFGWRVAEQAPNAIRILNTEDLHGLRKSREEYHKKGEGFALEHWKDHPVTLRELTSIYRSDLSLMVSSFEMEILHKELDIPKELLLHLPFLLEQIHESEMGQWPKFDERQDFICVGNGLHAPNVDAVKILKTTIWPLIRKQLPKAKLRIYGAYLPQQILQLHNPKEGFLVEGWVEDLQKVLRSTKVCLAPLQFGAGIKGKLIEAMKNGTPSVTTEIGAEGMRDDLPWNGHISKDWSDFAKAAVTLYQNEEVWMEAQTNGINIVHSMNNKKILQGKLQERVSTLHENLNTHRNQNLIGKLLQQQTLSSTKYMSKWIEEKNKRKE